MSIVNRKDKRYWRRFTREKKLNYDSDNDNKVVKDENISKPNCSSDSSQDGMDVKRCRRNDDWLKAFEVKKANGQLIRGAAGTENGRRFRHTSKSETDSSESEDEFKVEQKENKKTMKNAVTILYEMFPHPTSPQYRVTSMAGKDNNATFSMTCTLQDQTFSGTGRSKKEAKLVASQKALQKMFSKDSGEVGGSKVSDNVSISNPRSLSEIDSWLEVKGKNPVSILNELHPEVIFQHVSSEGPKHAPQFSVRATLASLSYEGKGGSKKEAKLNASKALLVHIFRFGLSANANDELASAPVWEESLGGPILPAFRRIKGDLENTWGSASPPQPSNGSLLRFAKQFQKETVKRPEEIGEVVKYFHGCIVRVKDKDNK